MAALTAAGGPGSRRHNRKWWRAHVAAQPRSGLSAAAYCQGHGLNPKCFYRWRRIFAETLGESVDIEGCGEEAGRALFAEVCISQTPLASSGVEVCLGGGRVIRVAPGFDAPTLCRVVSALEDCAPC